MLRLTNLINGLIFLVIVGFVSAVAIDAAYSADAHVINQGNGPAHTSSMKLFTNATGVETGTEFNLQFMPKNHTWFTEITGTASAVNIILEGSIDGTNWFTTSSSRDLRSLSEMLLLICDHMSSSQACPGSN